MKLLKNFWMLMCLFLFAGCSAQQDQIDEFIDLWKTSDMTSHSMEVLVQPENAAYFTVGFLNHASLVEYYENSTAEEEKIQHAIDYRSKRDDSMHDLCTRFLDSVQYKAVSFLEYDPSKLLLHLMIDVGKGRSTSIYFASDGKGFVFGLMRKRVYFAYESDLMDEVLKEAQKYSEDPWY